jgi:starch-binding outer membrane protein, SusD/RagB family
MKKYIDMIKRLKYAALMFSAVIMTFTSCERPYLQPWPPDGARTPDDVWNNYYFTRGFLDALYADQGPTLYYNDIEGAGMLASATDEAMHSDPQGAVRNFTNGIWNPTSVPTVYTGGPWSSYGQYSSPWDNSYRGIRRTNIFLENVDNSVFIDDVSNPARANDRTYGKGQAYYWRAFLQFQILKRYGPFPIITQSQSLEDDILIPRNTLDECVAQIIEDCDNAIERLPLLWADNNWYRINRTGAQALKARVLLYYASPLYQGDFESLGLPANSTGDIERWQDAADAAKAAIDGNNFYNLMTVTKFNRPYSSTNTYIARIAMTHTLSQFENIWSTSSYTTSQVVNEYRNMPTGIEGCYGYTNPTQEMVDAFEVVPVDANNRPVTGATSVAFDWNIPAHAANPYANRDPRFYASINYNGYFWGNSSSLGYYIDTYDGGVHRNITLPTTTKTGYYFRKWLTEAFYAYRSGGYTSPTRGKIEFRFAELLLNYAEAMNEAYGPDISHPDGALRVGGATARTALNTVRARVNMPAIPLGLTQAEMREKIKHERRIELCFEDHRFYDVRRWKNGELFGGPVHGIKITPTGFDVNNRPTGFTYLVEQVETRVWDEKMYWWPIPYSEIVKYEGKLTQNPGWGN